MMQRHRLLQPGEGWEHSDVLLGRTTRFLKVAAEHRSWGLLSRFAGGQSLASPHNSGRLGAGDTAWVAGRLVPPFFPMRKLGTTWTSLEGMPSWCLPERPGAGGPGEGCS